jgi:hypothetical protein
VVAGMFAQMVGTPSAMFRKGRSGETARITQECKQTTRHKYKLRAGITLTSDCATLRLYVRHPHQHRMRDHNHQIQSFGHFSPAWRSANHHFVRHQKEPRTLNPAHNNPSSAFGSLLLTSLVIFLLGAARSCADVRVSMLKAVGVGE